MSESLFLSKAFSNSMHPMKILPFFYKASDVFDDDDITVTTLVTNNRFHVLRALAERYDGPLSVTIHLPFSPGDSLSSLQANLATLHKLLRSSPALASRADIHLVISPFPRAFNAWRNLARLAVRTKYILLLDVDFALCTSWRVPVQSLLRGTGEIARRMREGSAALVIPAFEYVRAAEGRDQSMFPRNKQDLYNLVRVKTVAPFHMQWAPGHNSTDYERFFKARPGEIYRVTQYQSAYEPYVIVKSDAGGWCDERFTGYGGNKAACLFEMYLSGISFYVLGDHFLIHQNHLYEEEARRSERKYNRKIYADFKEEACLRYIRRFYDEGTLNTTRGHNAQEECQKIKGIGKIVTQVLCTANLLQLSGFVITIAFLGFIWPLKQPPVGCFSGRISPVS
ncbi:glycosyltransferase family 49 protein [Heterobasidion irregulare TC 32-1]|uniref:Glycosyltransferase family 49 protein n=1 Tax=Heterobasidion irregulare (strain TC 32-1) TaxID=747525 RepID=W4K5J4_HETIT|nr:glycosyltransferase family 49 protein [Heterobasidion irregulare TC 32-1]ETW80635.1 glycosyltransferase family 49 protein [Heterobasidion irregulare TC 32-1]